MPRRAPGLLLPVALVALAAVTAVLLRVESGGSRFDEGLKSVAPPPPATTTPPRPDGPWPALSAGAPAGVLFTTGGVMAPITADTGGGTYEVQTPCDARAVVRGYPLQGAHVVLDPGHGGSEPGAVGPNGLLEKDLNLTVARRVAEILRAEGATVVMTRETDLRVTIATRAGIALALRPVAFLSIHHNAAPDGPSAAPGTEAYFQVSSPDSHRLAGLVVEEVRAALAPFGVAWTSDVEPGAKARVRASNPGEDFYGVLRRTAGVTSVLSEAAYLSNPAEADLLAREDVQQAEAEALARALTRFVGGESPGEAAYAPGPPSTGASGGSGGGAEGCVDPAL
jgi:N-acetylmuramoyl-L-alanine amidase